MGVSRRNIVWVCLVSVVAFCFGVEEKDAGECVQYYLCDTGGIINTDGRNLIKPRSGIFSCDHALEVRCHLPRKGRNGTEQGKSEQIATVVPASVSAPTPSKKSPLSPPQAAIPGRDCGVRRNQPDLLTSNHSNGVSTGSTHLAEFPWMIVLLIQDSNNPSQYTLKCGASLISPVVVATAAHCIFGVDQKTLKVRAGAWDIQTEDKNAPHQDRSVANVHIHPGFDAGNLHNDIALIIVDSPFEFKGHVDVICLPNQNAIFDNTRCVVTGWGKDSFGDRAFKRILRKVDLSVVPKNVCEERFHETRLGRHFELDESFICAGGEVGKDTCQGDGGSPLICPLPQDPRRWTQVGIVSWGLECGDDTPAVYTNVAVFVDWIISHFSLTDASTDPLSLLE